MVAIVWDMRDGTPFPFVNKTNRGKPKKYPFGELRIGDSFVLSARCTTSSQLSAAVRHHEVKHGGLFHVRKINDEVRCWRLE